MLCVFAISDTIRVEDSCGYRYGGLLFMSPLVNIPVSLVIYLFSKRRLMRNVAFLNSILVSKVSGRGRLLTLFSKKVICLHSCVYFGSTGHFCGYGKSKCFRVAVKHRPCSWLWSWLFLRTGKIFYRILLSQLQITKIGVKTWNNYCNTWTFCLLTPTYR